MSSRFLCVAVRMRTSASIERVPPTFSKLPSSSTRSILTCMLSGMSPISSRNSVPPWARSKRPTVDATAPVNAPRSWPNNSLSSNSPGMAPQLTGTKGLPSRPEMRCRLRATTSLPVPDSPVISTFTSVSASLATTSLTRWIAGLTPISPCTAASPRVMSESAVPARYSWQRRALCKTSSRSRKCDLASGSANRRARKPSPANSGISFSPTRTMAASGKAESRSSSNRLKSWESYPASNTASTFRNPAAARRQPPESAAAAASSRNSSFIASSCRAGSSSQISNMGGLPAAMTMGS